MTYFVCYYSNTNRSEVKRGDVAIEKVNLLLVTNGHSVPLVFEILVFKTVSEVGIMVLVVTFFGKWKVLLSYGVNSAANRPRDLSRRCFEANKLADNGCNV